MSGILVVRDLFHHFHLFTRAWQQRKDCGDSSGGSMYHGIALDKPLCIDVVS